MDIKYLVYEEINESNSETIQQNNSFIKENTDTRISSISTFSYASKKKCNMSNKNMQKFRDNNNMVINNSYKMINNNSSNNMVINNSNVNNDNSYSSNNKITNKQEQMDRNSFLKNINNEKKTNFYINPKFRTMKKAISDVSQASVPTNKTNINKKFNNQTYHSPNFSDKRKTFNRGLLQVPLNDINNNININNNNTNNNFNNNISNTSPTKKENNNTNVNNIINTSPTKKENNNNINNIINTSPTKKENNNNFEIINYHLLNSNINDNENNYETFCICAFVSGVIPPVKTTSMITGSEELNAPCGHLACSLFPSIQPELLNVYIKKNVDIHSEITNLVANMCFPLGIKPCFECSFDENNNKINNLQNPQEIFYNVIKNEKNEVYYFATLQYFIKMNIQDFIYKYNINPTTYYLNYEKNNNKDKKYKKNIQNISKILSNNTVFIPESISLVSKYPCFMAMNKCLKSLISLQNEDMNSLLNHLINEVPFPKKHSQIQFYIPKLSTPIVLNHENNKYLIGKNSIANLSISQINTQIIFQKISVENIIMIFHLILLEQKILFMDNDYQILSIIPYIFINLIYPLTWINPFIPVLSLKTVRFLQSPVPYIMGLDEFLLKYADQSNNIYLGNEMIIFNISKDYFVSSTTRKHIHKKEVLHEYKLASFPEKVGDFLYKELKKIKKIMEKNKKEDCNINLSEEEIDFEVRLIFLKAMIMLIGDYNNFSFYTEDEVPLFNKEAFFESHTSKSFQNFLSQMVETQIFHQFLLNEKNLYFKKLNKNDIDYELVDTSFFKKMISKFPELLNTEEIRKRAISIKKQSKKRVFSSKKFKKFNSIHEINKKNTIKNVTPSNHQIEQKLKKEKEGNELNVGVINPISNEYKDNLLNEMIPQPGMGNLSIDLMRIGPKKASFHNNVNLNAVNLSSNYIKSKNLGAVSEINRSHTKTPIMDKNINNLSTIKINKFLLYPYFIPYCNNDNIITLDYILNELNNYYKIKKIQLQPQDKFHIFIITKRKAYNFDIISSNKVYIISNKSQENQKTESNFYIPKNSSKFTIVEDSDTIYKTKTDFNIPISKLENRILFKNEEDIKCIKEIFRLICTNKTRITSEQFTTLDKILQNEKNKLFLAQLIIPDTKIKKQKNHKQLTANAFEDLQKIISIAFKYLTSNEFNTCRLLTISCFTYYKIENKNVLVYLYENFIHGIYPCRLWLLDDFWDAFFKLEYDEENKINDDSLSENIYNTRLVENNTDDILLNVALFLGGIMIKLQISQKIIMNLFNNVILDKYEDNIEKKNLIINQIINLFE